MIVRGSAAYPVNLDLVAQAPPALFIRGKLLGGDALAVSVVGTRRASPAGLALAARLAAELAQAGVTVVSGLARGIDAAAHLGALAAGGRTVAVLGSGLDHLYPPEHAALAAAVCISGALVSQWWPWAPPAASQFRERNAVSSGLALATVVVEASARSGARLQGRLALEQGRLLLLSQLVVRSEAWAAGLVASGAAGEVDGAGAVLQALADRSQVSVLAPNRPVPPGQSGQLRLDIE